MGVITKSINHAFFWVEDEILGESYHTHRGLRYTEIAHVPGEPDKERLTDEDIARIQEKII